MPDINIERPNTQIWLTHVPWESDYKHVMRFEDADDAFEQITAIQGTAPLINYSYQSKYGTLRVKGNVSLYEKFNYCVILNGDLYNPTHTYEKYIFAFIEKVDYINPNTTRLWLNLDVWQTYGYDVTFPTMMVEREHTNDDSYGANILDEGFNVRPEVVCISDVISNTDYPDVSIVCAVSRSLNHIETLYCLKDSNFYGSGLEYHAFRIRDQWDDFLDFINQYNDLDTRVNPDEIVAIFTMPSSLLSIDTQADDWNIVQASVGLTIQIPVSRLNFITIDGYTPHNKKLFTYPYIAYRITNLSDTISEYKFEYTKYFFDLWRIDVNIRMPICPSSQLFCGVVGYCTSTTETQSHSYFPITTNVVVPWSTDAFSSWLSSNRASLVLNSLSTLGTAALSIL